jgi:hypothetical protein
LSESARRILAYPPGVIIGIATVNFDPTISFSSIIEVGSMLLGLAIVWGSINTKLDAHTKQLDAMSTVDKQVAVHEIRLTEHDRRLDKIEHAENHAYYDGV